MKNDDVQELLALIDQSPYQQFKPQSLFQPVGQIYTTLRILYQHFKKDHQLQIMQARIFKIPVQEQREKTFSSTPVTAQSLCKYHSLKEQDIQKMIIIKDHLKPQPQKQLYQSILVSINKLNKIAPCLRCYKKLLNSQYLKGDMKQYRIIEQIMINKLVSLKYHKIKDINIVVRNVVGLPKIDQPIIVFISLLYDKIEDIRYFMPLFKIFQNNFPKEPTLIDYQALFRICLPQTLTKILVFFKEKTSLRNQLMEIAQKEVKNKLKVMGSKQTSKTSYTLSFIVEMVKLGVKAWQQIVEWQAQAQDIPKQTFKSMIQSRLIIMLNDFKLYFQTIVQITQQLQRNQKHSIIGLILVRQLLKLQHKHKLYLSHKTIRKFLAIKILNYNSSQNYTEQIFSSNLKYADVINEMFSYKAYIGHFYQHILSQKVVSFKLLQKYLSQLVSKQPQKFKTFFLKVLLADNQKYQYLYKTMFKLLVERITAQIAASLLKDIAVFPPPKNLPNILSQMLVKFKNTDEYSIIKKQILRTLNIILCRTPKGDFPMTFQLTLPIFLKENLKEQTNDIFKLVPQQTKAELKKNFDRHSKMGFEIK